MSTLGFNHPNLGKQLITFSGLLNGNISATDLDGYVEFHNLCHVFFEIKASGVQLPKGQERAFEILCDDLSKVKETIFIVGEHGIYDPNENIVAKDCTVRKFRYRGKWIYPKQRRTVKEVEDIFIKLVEKKLTTK